MAWGWTLPAGVARVLKDGPLQRQALAAAGLALAAVLTAWIVAPVLTAGGAGPGPNRVTWIVAADDGRRRTPLEGEAQIQAGRAGWTTGRTSRQYSLKVVLGELPSGALAIFAPSMPGYPRVFVNGVRIGGAGLATPPSPLLNNRGQVIEVPGEILHPDANRVDVLVDSPSISLWPAGFHLGRAAPLEAALARQTAAYHLLPRLAVLAGGPLMLVLALLALFSSTRRLWPTALAFALLTATAGLPLAPATAIPPEATRWLADILSPALALTLAGAVLARATGRSRRFGAMAGSTVAIVLVFAILRLPWPSWDGAPEQASALLGVVLTLAGIGGASWGALRTRAALLAGHGPALAAIILGLTWLICAAFARSTLASPLAGVTAEIAAGVVGAMLLWGALLTACHRLVVEVEAAWRTRANLTRLVSEQRKRIGEQDEIIRREIQQRAVLEERERLTRDIHDGIGSQLVSLLVRVRLGSISQTDLEAEIESGLNDLRLIVDSLDHAGEAFLAALSLAQTRLRPQIEGAGLTFDWVQADSSLPPTVTPRTTMNILRILQEALANAVKHARADRVRVMIEGRTAPSRLVVTITDDGRSMAEGASVSMGRGVGSMRHRAAAIDGEIRITPGPDGKGTEVRPEAPLEAG